MRLRRAERIGRDTSYGKIIEAVEQSERSRAPVQRLADRLAGYLVYFALGAAVLTYLCVQIARFGLAMLILLAFSGGCALVLALYEAFLGMLKR